VILYLISSFYLVLFVLPLKFVLKSCLSLIVMDININIEYWCSSERRSVRSNAFVRVETTICRKHELRTHEVKSVRVSIFISASSIPFSAQSCHFLGFQIAVQLISTIKSAAKPLTHHDSRYCTHPRLDILS
jgi:hypothetical protein